MDRLLILLLVSVTLSGCARVASYEGQVSNITKYNTLTINDFALDEEAYPGLDAEYQNRTNPIFLSASRKLSEDIGRVIMAKRFFDTVNINDDHGNKEAIIVEGTFLWFGRHLISVKGRLIDGLTDETVIYFQHEVFDRTGTVDLIAVMGEHLGMFIGSTRCAQLPSFSFCPARQ